MRVDPRAVLCRCLPLAILAVVWVAARRDASIGSLIDPEWYISAERAPRRRLSTVVQPPAPSEMTAASEAEEVAAIGRRPTAGKPAG